MGSSSNAPRKRRKTTIATAIEQDDELKILVEDIKQRRALDEWRLALEERRLELEQQKLEQEKAERNANTELMCALVAKLNHST